MKFEIEVDSFFYDIAKKKFFEALEKYKAKLQPIMPDIESEATTNCWVTANPADQNKMTEIVELYRLEQIKLQIKIKEEVLKILMRV